jgi:fatty-acid peroxygenase
MSIPGKRTTDESLSLLREGYRFISNRCLRFGSDVFETRLMLRPVICMSGAEAAEMFYKSGRFTRWAAIPQTALRLLQDQGSVATLDGSAHRHRKAMFLAIMTPTLIGAMADAFEEEWRARLPTWELSGKLVFFEEVTKVLTHSACAWVGVPLDEPEATARTQEFAAMIDGAGAVGPRNWRGLWHRRRQSVGRAV